MDFYILFRLISGIGFIIASIAYYISKRPIIRYDMLIVILLFVAGILGVIAAIAGFFGF